MKVLILKNIPGLKKGLILNSDNGGYVRSLPSCAYTYSVHNLIEEGYAEEIKNDADMEKIREQFSIKNDDIDLFEFIGNARYAPSYEELEWFSAYRIVSNVIEQLNGNWEPDYSDGEWNKHIIYYAPLLNEFYSEGYCKEIYNILPPLKDRESARELVILCTPELKILFKIK